MQKTKIAVEDQIELLQKEINELSDNVAEKKKLYEKAHNEYEAIKSNIAECDSELKNLVKIEKNLLQEKSTICLNLKKLENKLNQLEKV